MTILNRLSVTGVVAVALACLSAPLGCEGEAKQVSTGPETQPAAPSAAAAGQKPDPLPPKALTKLEDLDPKVSKPAKGPEKGPLPARVMDDVTEAEKLVAEKKVDAAIALLERAVGFAPNDARIRRLLGKAYLALPNRGKAVTQLTAAVKADGDDLETHLLLGQLAASRQQINQAILELRTALKCSQAKPEDPHAGEALLTLSLLLDRVGYWTAALEGYTRLSEWIDGHARDYAERPALREWALRPERLLSRRGGLLLLLRKPDEAVKLLERAYRRDRSNGRAATLLIDALLATESFAEAEKRLLEMAGQPSQQANVPRMLESLCRRTQEKALPERFWAQFRAKYKTDPAIAVALAKAAEDMGWDDVGLSILKSVVTVDPADGDLWKLLCRNYARRGKYVDLYDVIKASVSASAEAIAPVAAALDATAHTVKTDGVERDFAEKARADKSPVRHAMLYLAGRVASARRKYLLAADLYTRATECKKDFYPAYEALLEAYTAQKRPDRVDRLLEQIATLAKDTHLPAYFRGKVALSRGDAAGAVDALKQALLQNSDDLPTILLLAKAYVAAGNSDKGAQTLQKALATHPDNDELIRRLFDLYMATRKLSDAQTLATQVLRRDRESMIGRLMIAELALRTGRRTQAMILLGQLAREAPDNADVQLLSVRALLGPEPGLVSKKQFDETADNLARIMRIQPDNRSAREALAELLAAVDKADEAAGIWVTIFDEKPDDLGLARNYVTALVRIKQYKQALRAVERFRKAKPEDLWGRVRALELLGEVKRFDEAVKLGKEWIAQATDDNIQTLHRQELLQVLRQGKRYDEALKIVDEWIAQKPSRLRLRQLEFERIRLLGLAGRYDEANKIVKERFEADPLNQTGRILLATIVEAEKYDDGMKLLDGWIEQSLGLIERLNAVTKAVEDLSKSKATTSPAYKAAAKQMPEALQATVTAAVEGKRYDQATKAVELWSKQVEASLDDLRELRIIVCGKSKQLGRARHLAEEWIKASPESLPPRRALVGLLAESEAEAEAAKLVDRWLKQLTGAGATTQPDASDETLAWLREMAVRLQLGQGKCAEALKLADAYTKLDPNNTDMLALKSTCLGELHRDDEALAVMEAAYAMKPNDPSLCNNLGYLYSERGVQLDKAEKMLEKALSLRPGELAFEDSLAWIYYKQGKLQDAGRAFQRLLRDREDDEVEHGVILDHAGDAYYRLGWKDHAAALWKRALELGKKVKKPMREDKQLLVTVEAKLKAVKEGREPVVAPLGESAKVPEGQDQNQEQERE